MAYLHLMRQYRKRLRFWDFQEVSAVWFMSHIFNYFGSWRQIWKLEDDSAWIIRS